MSTKDQEKGLADSCLNMSQPEEPVFVLCARDPLAAVVVTHWAYLAFSSGLHNDPKAAEAQRVAKEMRRWRDEREL